MHTHPRTYFCIIYNSFEQLYVLKKKILQILFIFIHISYDGKCKSNKILCFVSYLGDPNRYHK